MSIWAHGMLILWFGLLLCTATLLYGMYEAIQGRWLGGLTCMVEFAGVVFCMWLVFNILRRSDYR